MFGKLPPNLPAVAGGIAFGVCLLAPFIYDNRQMIKYLRNRAEKLNNEAEELVNEADKVTDATHCARARDRYAAPTTRPRARAHTHTHTHTHTQTYTTHPYPLTPAHQLNKELEEETKRKEHKEEPLVSLIPAGYESGNIFAKILAGAIPSWKVLETEHAVAILDAFPAAEGVGFVPPLPPIQAL